jgi:cytochrome b6-f complex iron-sulfur subunit
VSDPIVDATASGRDAQSRRHFLRQLESRAIAAACCGGILPLLATACSGARYARSSTITPDGTRIAIDRAELSSTATLVDGPQGALPIAVRALDADRYIALSTRCMHRGCQVEPSADRYVCPCHGSEYALDGAVLKGPTELPLVRYNVSVDAARVYVHLDSPLLIKGGAS